jgi:hypothetical protein
MRTTLDLDLDTLMAIKELARQENQSQGKVVSRLLRMALTGQVAQDGTPAPAEDAASPTGFVPFASRGVVVSNELIDRLRDSS